MKRLPITACLLSLLVLTTSCKDIMHVQTGYVSDRDECRGNAENNAGVYSQPEAYPMSDKERNTALLQLFCECMRDRDWKVAGCPKPPPPVVATAQPAPTVVVVQSPTAQPAILPAPAPAAAGPAPAPHRGSKRKCTVPQNTCAEPTDSPVSGSYSPAPSATPATPDQENQQLNGILQRQ